MLPPMKFYRKLNPRTKFYLASTGRHVQFDTLDNQVGYYATDNADVIREIEVAQREQRGGITEITHEEYERDYAQKKRQSPEFRPKQLNREEITPGQNTSDTLTTSLPKSGQEADAGRAVRVALSGSDIEAGRKIVAPAPVIPAAPVVEDRPAPPPVRTKKTSEIKTPATE
jgi:hypothetical protein